MYVKGDQKWRPGMKQNPIEWVVENDCYRCTSHCVASHGRPHVRRHGKTRLVIHVLWEEKYGPIPKGLVLRHDCDNRWCININHGSLGTQKQNIHDAIRRGRMGIKKQSRLMAIESRHKA